MKNAIKIIFKHIKVQMKILFMLKATGCLHTASFKSHPCMLASFIQGLSID